LPVEFGAPAAADFLGRRDSGSPRGAVSASDLHWKFLQSKAHQFARIRPDRIIAAVASAHRAVKSELSAGDAKHRCMGKPGDFA
jgi:hypothetical protein